MSMYYSRQKLISSKVLSKTEFESWRKKGNELAVDALKNSDKLSWQELESKLLLSLNYYDQTPGLDLIYCKTLLTTQRSGGQQSKNMVEMNDYLMAQIKKTFLNQVLKLEGRQLRRDDDLWLRNVQQYFDEIYRVSKNKAVCYRALI